MDQSEILEIVGEIREVYVKHNTSYLDIITISEVIKLMAYNGEFGD